MSVSHNVSWTLPIREPLSFLAPALLLHLSVISLELVLHSLDLLLATQRGPLPSPPPVFGFSAFVREPLQNIYT
jgi:hypothetical protein